MSNFSPSPAKSETSRAASQPSSPLREVQSSPFRFPASSPITRSRTPSPPQQNVSSDSDWEGCPPTKKRYTIMEPEVPHASVFWPPANNDEEGASSFDAELLHQNEEFNYTHNQEFEDNLIGLGCDRSLSSVEMSDSSEVNESVLSSDPESSVFSIVSRDPESSSDSESVSSDSELASPLYHGSNVTVDETIYTLMNVFLKHKLEKTAVGSMLKVLHKCLPSDNLLPKSQYLLFKYVENLCPLPPGRVHYYCKTCIFYLGEEMRNCPLCDSDTANGKFYQLSISHQIKFFFENHNLAKCIDKYMEERDVSLSEGYYSDLCDGTVIKSAKIQGQYNLTLVGHTDGVSVSESSNASLWPLEFVISELHPYQRYRFVIIAGIWLDSSKPSLNCYFKPFIEELNELYHTGVTWTHPVTGENQVSRVVCPVFCCDAPVRAQIQNILSHGGKYCCNVCEQKMVRLPPVIPVPGVKKRKRRRIFDFQEEPCQLRTAKRMRMQAEITQQRRIAAAGGEFIAEKGVRGLSIITKVPQCDRSTVVFPEYMHLLIGIMKCFMTLWFSRESDNYSLKKLQDKINEFLINIRVPDFVTRIPRSTESFAKWKANEFRSFLLYFSLVIFSVTMEEKYLQHWILFVNAMFLLLQETVSQNDVVSADIMLRMFLRDFPNLYSNEAFAYNFHNLLHLRQVVERYGPLSCNSAFPFENYNGILKKCIHGSKNQGAELMNTIKLGAGVHMLQAGLNAPANDFEEASVQLRDKLKKIRLEVTEDELLSSAGIEKPYSLYKRVVINREIFTSTVYTLQKKRNNYTVQFIDSSGNKGYGEIKFYCKDKPDSNQIFVLINPFEIEHVKMFTHNLSGTIVKHIIPIKNTTDVQLVPLKNILSKVIRVGSFVCLRPNKIEVNL